MDAKQLLVGRRSIRKYKPEIISQEIMKEVIDVAKFAPSWANFQIARYNLITNQGMIKDIANKGVNGFAYNISTLENAKNVAVISYVQGKSGKLDLEKEEYATTKKDQWEVFDAGIATQTFCLAAYEKGIGTCIFGVIDGEAIAKIIGLPEGETVATVVTYGYPDEKIDSSPRKATEELVRFYE